MNNTIETLMAQYEKMHTAYVFGTQKDFKREALKLGDDLRELRAELRGICKNTCGLEKPDSDCSEIPCNVKEFLGKETTP